VITDTIVTVVLNGGHEERYQTLPARRDSKLRLRMAGQSRQTAGDGDTAARRDASRTTLVEHAGDHPVTQTEQHQRGSERRLLTSGLVIAWCWLLVVPADCGASNIAHVRLARASPCGGWVCGRAAAARYQPPR
jgi:hypothetical protein